jgi:DNA-binding LacI/PurR family transcriptional regulator
MTSRRITMKDIARELQVSVMTVSYALKGSKQVSPQTRNNVLEAAKRLGYVPDPLLTRLSSYRSQRARSARGTCLAWLNLHSTEKTWNFRGSHFLESYEGARKRAEELGYHLEAIHVHKLGSWKRTNAVLKSRGIEGVIIGQPPVGVDSADLEWSEFSTVSVGRAIRSPELPRVVLNHVAAIYQLLERMLSMGYRRIGLVMESDDCIKNDFRNIGGYYAGCAKHGIPQQDRVPPLTPEKLTAAHLENWIKEWNVEGILIHRPDQMQKLLPQIGLKVPGDIGYAHISLHEPSPLISGLFFAPENLGSWAVDLCHWILDRDEKGLQDPTPALMLSTFNWNKGTTLREQSAPADSLA